MRSNQTLDRILLATSLLRSGDHEAAVETLTAASKSPDFEQDFVDLNRLQALAHGNGVPLEDADPQDLGESHDGLRNGDAVNGLSAHSHEDGQHVPDGSEFTARPDESGGPVEPQLAAAGRSGQDMRRTRMMLDNLKRLRSEIA